MAELRARQASPEALDTTEGFVSDGREAWLGFLVVHSEVTRRLDALLVAEHGMTLSEYEVLLKLDTAGGMLRMSDLAEAALLSRSGLTRIVDELEARQWVERLPSETDGRVLNAILTPEGRSRLRAARVTHIENVHALFLEPLGPQRRKQLGLAWEAIEAALSTGSAGLGSRGSRRRTRGARRRALAG